jgi:hypothetical protein
MFGTYKHENSFAGIRFRRLQDLLQEMLVPALPGLRFHWPKKYALEAVL